MLPIFWANSLILNESLASLIRPPTYPKSYPQESWIVIFFHITQAGIPSKINNVGKFS